MIKNFIKIKLVKVHVIFWKRLVFLKYVLNLQTQINFKQYSIYLNNDIEK